MKSGKMRHRISVGGPSTELNEVGTPVPVGTGSLVLRAEKVEASSAEAIRGNGANDEGMLVFRTRFTPLIQVSHDLYFEGRQYSIKVVTEIGHRAGLEIRCALLGEACN